MTGARTAQPYVRAVGLGTAMQRLNTRNSSWPQLLISLCLARCPLSCKAYINTLSSHPQSITSPNKFNYNMAGRMEVSLIMSSMLVLFVLLLLGNVMASNDMDNTKDSFSMAGMRDGKEPSGPWANWVQEKLSERDNARMASDVMKDKAGGFAAMAKDKMTEAASGAANKAGEMRDAAGKVYEGAKETMNNAYLGTKDSMSIPSVKNKVGGMPRKVADGFNTAASTAGKAFEGAKESMSNYYQGAKDSMSTLNAKDLMTMDRAGTMKDKAGEVAGKIQEGAQNAANTAGKTFEDAKESMSNYYQGAKDSMSIANAKDSTTMMDRAGTMKDKAGEVAGKMQEGAQNAANTAGKAFEGAKETMSNAYMGAKDSMSIANVKEGYEAAKEKITKTNYGDMRTRLSANPEEL